MSRPTLPEELVSQIFSYLEADEKFEPDSIKEQVLRQTTFISGCLASKTFYRIILPIYYRTSDLSFCSENVKMGGPFNALLRSGDTASLVRRLRMPVSSQGRGEDCTLVSPDASSFETIKSLREVAENPLLHEETQRRLLESIEGMRAGAVCGAILWACSNLQVLHLRTKGSERTLPTALLDLAGQAADSPFRNLHELVIEHKPDPHSLALDKMLHVFSLPRLRTFRGFGISLEYPRGSEKLKVGKSELERIELHGCRIHLWGMENLLEIRPTLTHLTIVCYVDGVRVFFQLLGRVGFILERSATSLKSLTLQIDDLGSVHLDRIEAPSCGSLRALEELSSLTVSKRLLTGGIPNERWPDHLPFNELLPFSLQELHVTEELDSDLDHMVGCIEPLLSDDRFRGLRVISIRGIEQPRLWPRLSTVKSEASSVGWNAGWIDEDEFEFRRSA